MPHASRFLVVLAAASLLGACARAPVAVPGAAEATIPRGALSALRAHWAGAALTGSPTAACPGEPAAPSLLSGDLNGDGTADTVVWVKTAEATRLAAVFARVGREYLVVEVGSQDERPLGGRLELLQRGTLLRTPDGQFDPHLGLDTISLRQCDGSRTAWLWTGSGFRPRPIVN